MTRKEVIDTLKIAKAEVEWNYPLDYAIAIDQAIDAIIRIDLMRAMRLFIIPEAKI